MRWLLLVLLAASAAGCCCPSPGICAGGGGPAASVAGYPAYRAYTPGYRRPCYPAYRPVDSTALR
jgi:hypothetical protein